ncbi:MAG: MOSC domain-containing protein [Mycobacteriales bacterium]
MTPVVTAVCVVHEIKRDSGRMGKTAIDKRPVTGSVAVEPLGLAGDTQCDRKFHGGPNAALYAYAREEAGRWAAELGREIPPGFFGENLATTGLDVTDALVGERWRIGDTVEVTVTGPRVPCATFARHIDVPQWVKRFSARTDVGAYLRVDVTGTIRAGDQIAVLERPSGVPTIREVYVAKCRIGTA